MIETIGAILFIVAYIVFYVKYTVDKEFKRRTDIENYSRGMGSIDDLTDD